MAETALRGVTLVVGAFLGLSGPVSAARPDFERIFKGKDGCFILLDLQSGKPVIEYNRKRCDTRVSPCSTFKIPLALMAFDQGIFQDENSPVRWDGIKRDREGWNKDQTPRTWLKESTVWVSQWLTPQIGKEKIARYLADFRYGNQDMSGGITQAWLSSTLEISAAEQIEFMKRFWRGQLALAARAVDLSKKCMDEERSKSGAVLHGKTGSGTLAGGRGRKVGWYVGHLSRDGREYLFSTNFEDLAESTPGPAGFAARDIARLILSKLGFF